MSDLICENYNLLLVMSRFGLSLGFGDKTVEQVCEQQGVHTGTFLAVVNFMDDECCVADDFRKELSIEALMDYLKRAHTYFLDFKLQAIRNKLVQAFECPEGEMAALVLKFYDAYVGEVEVHMGYENQVVSTLSGNLDYLDRVQQGFRACVSSGKCGSVFASMDVEIAGKTGTAEVGDSTSTAFIGYGPYDDPSVSFACVAPTSSDTGNNLQSNICTNEVMGQVLDETLAMDGPVICEIFVTVDQPFEPKSASKRLADGSIVSAPLEDLAPFLPDEEMDEIMIIPRIKG